MRHTYGIIENAKGAHNFLSATQCHHSTTLTPSYMLFTHVQINPNAKGARNFSQCDSMLIGDTAAANTYPYINVSYMKRGGAVVAAKFGPSYFGVASLKSLAPLGDVWAMLPQVSS